MPRITASSIGTACLKVADDRWFRGTKVLAWLSSCAKKAFIDNELLNEGETSAMGFGRPAKSPFSQTNLVGLAGCG